MISEIRERLMFKLGDDIELIMKKVDHIPLTKRGKHRFLIQKLNIKFHDRNKFKKIKYYALGVNY